MTVPSASDTITRCAATTAGSAWPSSPTVRAQRCRPVRASRPARPVTIGKCGGARSATEGAARRHDDYSRPGRHPGQGRHVAGRGPVPGRRRTPCPPLPPVPGVHGDDADVIGDRGRAHHRDHHPGPLRPPWCRHAVPVEPERARRTRCRGAAVSSQRRAAASPARPVVAQVPVHTPPPAQATTAQTRQERRPSRAPHRASRLRHVPSTPPTCARFRAPSAGPAARGSAPPGPTGVAAAAS